MNLTKRILVILVCLSLRAAVVAQEPQLARPSWGAALQKVTASKLRHSRAGIASGVMPASPASAGAFGAGGVAWPISAGGNGHFYLLTHKALNWDEAEAEAVSFGGHLASVNSQAEQDFLVNNFLSGANQNRTLWIGLTDQATEGVFVWTSGEPLTFTDWSAGEPNNAGGAFEEDYGAMNWHFGHDGAGVVGAWNDVPLTGLGPSLGPEPYFGIIELPFIPGCLLDSGFGAGGLVTTNLGGSVDTQAGGFVVQPDGKIVVASRLSLGTDFILARYTSDGALDASFGAGGIVTTDLGALDIPKALLFQPDGKIVAAGTTHSTGQSITPIGMARYNADGSLDTGFGVNGKVVSDFGENEVVSAIARQSDGKIVAAGFIDGSGASQRFLLVRYNANGSLDMGFGVNGKVETAIPGTFSSQARGVAIQPDGRIVAAGSFDTDQLLGIALARYNTDGSLDTSFGANGIALAIDSSTNYLIANALVLQSDGKILTAGVDGGVTFVVARFNANGGLDSGFGANGLAPVQFLGGIAGHHAFAIALQPDGKIVAAGDTGISGALTGDFAVARLNPDGSLDTGFGLNGKIVTDFAGSTDLGTAVAIQPDGKIVAGGVAFVGNTIEVALARYGCAQCSFSINPTSQNFTAAGGSGSVNVTTAGGCDWTATSGNSFITITSPANGSGNGTVSFSVAANSGPARSGTMTVAGQTFTVTQDSGCAFSINPVSQNFTAAGGSGSVSVTTAGGCDWTATSNDSFITITSGASGSGNGTVNYSVAANSGAARAGTLTVAGLTFTVSQDAASAVAISAPTPVGLNVTVQLGGVRINFTGVTASGITRLIPTDPCAPTDPCRCQPTDPCRCQPGDPCRILPPGFSVFGNLAFDIQTTATFTGPITLSFDLSRLNPNPPPITPPDPDTPPNPITPAFVSTLRVFHGENGVLVDRTIPPNPITPPNPVKVAVVSSLSPFVIARQPPQAALQSALDDLRAVRQTITDRNDALRLDIDIQSLKLALDPRLWRDPTHLQPPTGVGVFIALGGAIVPLHAILGDPRSSIPAATARFYIDRILDVGRRLAVITIIDARAAGGDQQIIDSAAQEIIDGDADVTRDKFEEALADYALAWGKAQLALRGA